MLRGRLFLVVGLLSILVVAVSGGFLGEGGTAVWNVEPHFVSGNPFEPKAERVYPVRPWRLDSRSGAPVKAARREAAWP